MIHLDTNFLIGALTAGSPQDQRLRKWLAEGMTIGISSTSWAEFLCGPVDEESVELANELLAPAEPFLVDDAPVAARLFDLGGRRRGSFVDCMIAATAIRVGAELATENRDDFKRFEPGGLKLAAETEDRAATLAEMSEPDWRDRLVEAERDSQTGNRVQLEEFQARRGKRRSAKKRPPSSQS